MTNTEEPRFCIGPLENPSLLPVGGSYVTLHGDLARQCEVLVNRALSPYKKVLGVMAIDLFIGFLDKDEPEVILIEMSNTNPGMLAYGPKILLDMFIHRGVEGIHPEDLATPGYDIGEALGTAFMSRWVESGGSKDDRPVLGMFCPSMYRTAFSWDHQMVIRMLRDAGYDAYPIYPESRYEVKDGRFRVTTEGKTVELDMGFLRFSHFEQAAEHYKLSAQNIKNWNVVWLNDPRSFQIRSKVKVEQNLRLIEEITGDRIARPETLIEDGVTSRNIERIYDTYQGVVTKPVEGSGGSGIITYINNDIRESPWSKHYPDDFFFQGRGIVRIDRDEFPTISGLISGTSSFVSGLIKPDYIMVEGVPHVYDIRINVALDGNRYRIMNGLSRLAPTAKRKLSIITNVTKFVESGSSLMPLFFYPERTDGLGYTGEITKRFFN